MIPGQMDIFECIEIATTGSDGKPASPSPEREESDDVHVDEQIARRIANSLADDAVEKVEHDIGVELRDDQWESLCDDLELDFAEAIVETFAGLS